MTPLTAKKLVNLNTQFYKRVAQSFSDTRVKPWVGWLEGLETLFRGDFGTLLASNASKSASKVHILDLAAGNGRFEEFLLTKVQEHIGARNSQNICLTAIDNNTQMIKSSPLYSDSRLKFIELDILDALLEGNLEKEFTNQNISKAHLICSFGFMHHIPGKRNREKLLELLCKITEKHGYIFLSFWGFANDEKAKQKAEKYTEECLKTLSISHTELESNDNFLAWKNESIYRYCHNFEVEEVEDLCIEVCKSGNFKLITKFLSDGKDNKQNIYVILQKMHA